MFRQYKLSTTNLVNKCHLKLSSSLTQTECHNFSILHSMLDIFLMKNTYKCKDTVYNDQILV